MWDYVALGVQGSASGVSWGGSKDVKPFHNARKYGYDRSKIDMTPAIVACLGWEVFKPIYLELGLESCQKVYEYSDFMGTTQVAQTVSSGVSSLMLAPVFRRVTRSGMGFSVGCRLGWSHFEGQVETATSASLLGTKSQTSDVFATEPFARLDWGWEHFRVALDLGYATRKFFPIANSDATGIYAAGPSTERNPDGTDTAVDFSGFTDKIVAAFIF
jgi:hypothetical protein